MPTESESASFSRFVVTWLATVAVVKFKPSAYKEYEGIIRLHLVPAFGDLTLSAITVERIQVYIAGKLGSGLTPRSVINHVIVLKAVIGTAVDYGLILENPVDKVVRPRVERAVQAYLTPPQLRELIEATEPRFRLLIALPALCGLRKSECLAAEFSDVSVEDMTISINKSMRGGVVSTPKTKASTGVVPFGESLLPLIEQRRTSGHRLLFSKRDGSPLSDSTPNRILERALVAAHLPSIRFHDLRRSWCIAHLQAGTDVRTLMTLGRWSSSQTLLETYAAYIPPAGGEAVRKLDRLVNDQE